MNPHQHESTLRCRRNNAERCAARRNYLDVDTMIVLTEPQLEKVRAATATLRTADARREFLRALSNHLIKRRKIPNDHDVVAAINTVLGICRVFPSPSQGANK